MTVYSKDEIYGLMSDMAVQFLLEHKDYVIGNFSSSEGDLVLVKRLKRVRKDDIYIKFDYAEKGNYNKHIIKMFKEDYNRETKETKYTYLYESEPFYNLDWVDRKFTTDEEHSIKSASIRQERCRSREENKVKNGYKEITDRVLNAKLLNKVEELTDKPIKDQRLKYRSARWENDKYTTYYVQFVYRGKTYSINTSVKYQRDYDFDARKYVYRRESLVLSN